MLKFLRNKKTAKKVWIGLALIIIPAFALWGFGGAFRSREESRPAGLIFGRAVSDLELKDSLSAVTTMAIMQFGDKFAEAEKYLNLKSQAWDRLVLLEETKRRVIKTSNQEVIQLIESMPYFQYKSSFDNKTYTQTLQYVFHLQPRIFEEQMRQYLTMNKLFKQVTQGLSVDEKIVEKEYEKANQEISIYYIASLISDFAKNIKPKDSKLKDYFAKNKEAFKQPASLSSDKNKKEAVLPEFNSVKQKVREAFVNAEALKKAEDKINRCAQELISLKFNQAAKKCGLTVQETPAFKYGSDIKGIGPTDNFWEAAKSLKTGQSSPILKTPAGFYIIEVKSIFSLDKEKYQKGKIELTEKLLNQKKQEKLQEFIVELNKKAK